MRGLRVKLGFEAYSAIYLWIGFVVLFGLWVPHLFLTQATFSSVASSQAIPAMLALAVMVPLAAGVFDLSVGATANLVAVLVAVLQVNRHWGMWESILFGLLVGVIVGVVNGFIIVAFRIPSLIATLGMSSVIAAVQVIVAPDQPVSPTSHSWLQLSGASWHGIQIVTLYLLVMALILWWIMAHTPLGRYFYAIGGNVEAARLTGIRVSRYTFVSLIFASGIAGIAGVLYSSQAGPSLTFGSSLLLPAFAAAFLGSTQVQPGRFNVWGTILAIYVLATGVQGLEFVTSQQWLNSMFDGVALIGAVGMAVWRQSGDRRKRDWIARINIRRRGGDKSAAPPASFPDQAEAGDAEAAQLP